MGMRRPRGVLGSLGEDCRGSGKLLGGSCGLYMRRTLVAKGVLGVFDVAAMGALLGGLGGHDYDDCDDDYGDDDGDHRCTQYPAQRARGSVERGTGSRARGRLSPHL